MPSIVPRNPVNLLFSGSTVLSEVEGRLMTSGFIVAGLFDIVKPDYEYPKGPQNI